MTNTERLFIAMRDFTDKRRENREAYLRRKKSLEGYRGSAGYQKDLDAAMKIRKDADASARKECQRIVDEALADMAKKNASRTVEAPTEEQIRLLTVAGMIKKPSRDMLDTIANSLGGSPLALAALTSIAKEAWKDDTKGTSQFVPHYEAEAGEYTADSVKSIIRGLRDRCTRIMNGSGASLVREEMAKVHQTRYGGSVDTDDLPQEKPYTSKSDFYSRELGMMFSANGNGVAVDYDRFSKAVD